MKIRTKLRIALLLWAFGGLSILTISFVISMNFIVILFPLFICIGVYLISLKCPVCGANVLCRAIKINGMEIPFYISWLPRKCRKCNAEFDILNE